SLPKNRVFLDHVTSNRYDLYLLTETWLKDHHSMTSMLNHWINDYAVLRCDRSHRAGGGVSMFIRNTSNYTIIISESVPEAADIASPEFRLRIVLIYRPPSSTPSFSEQLAEAVPDLTTVSFPVIVLVTFASHGFKQYIKEPTRGNNILDLLFSNDHELLSNVSVNSSCDYTSITDYLFNILWIESFESVSTVDEKYDNDNLPPFSPSISSEMNTFPHFDPNDIYDALVKWPMSYSITPDHIPFVFVKNVAHVDAFPPSYLFNQSMMFSEVFRLWKHSYITPILKKPPSSDISNYRPISITFSVDFLGNCSSRTFSAIWIKTM
ncbi:hypothetical protein OSTOST_00860, partial [Ostertagia ostertagi]